MFKLLALVLKPFTVCANRSFQLSHQSPHTVSLSPVTRNHSPNTCPSVLLPSARAASSVRNALPHRQLCTNFTVSVTFPSCPCPGLPLWDPVAITVLSHCWIGLWTCAGWTMTSLRFYFYFNWFSFLLSSLPSQILAVIWVINSTEDDPANTFISSVSKPVLLMKNKTSLLSFFSVSLFCCC